jgi:hypothetical protein
MYVDAKEAPGPLQVTENVIGALDSEAFRHRPKLAATPMHSRSRAQGRDGVSQERDNGYSPLSEHGGPDGHSAAEVGLLCTVCLFVCLLVFMFLFFFFSP